MVEVDLVPFLAAQYDIVVGGGGGGKVGQCRLRSSLSFRGSLDYFGSKVDKYVRKPLVKKYLIIV